MELQGDTGEILHVIDVDSTNEHRIEVLPDGTKLYTENDEDAFATVVHLRKRIKDIAAPNGRAGLGASPDGSTIVMVEAKRPELLIVNTAADMIAHTPA